MADCGDSPQILWRKNTDFEEHFDPDAYFQTYLTNVEPGSYPEKLVQDFHEAFSQVAQLTGNSKLLDIGTGPSIHTVISASRVFSDIYLSDYASRCRQALQHWIDGDPDTNEWGSYFRLVGQLESKCPKEIEVRLRKAIKAVIPSDILSDDIVSQELGQFDAITTSGCLEACPDAITYRRAVSNMAALLKVGGRVVVFGFLAFDAYQVGEKVFGGLCQGQADIEAAFRDAGFEDLVFRPKLLSQKTKETLYEVHQDAQGVFTLSARKAQAC